jgi:hypothetical protein
LRCVIFQQQQLWQLLAGELQKASCANFSFGILNQTLLGLVIAKLLCEAYLNLAWMNWMSSERERLQEELEKAVNQAQLEPVDI